MSFAHFWFLCFIHHFIVLHCFVIVVCLALLRYVNGLAATAQQDANQPKTQEQTFVVFVHLLKYF